MRHAFRHPFTSVREDWADLGTGGRVGLVLAMPLLGALSVFLGGLLFLAGLTLLG